jgi:hypothetical protein
VCITISDAAKYLLWFVTGDEFLSANEDVLGALGKLLAALADRVETVLVGAATTLLQVADAGVEGALGEALRNVLSGYVTRPGILTWISSFCAQGGAVLERVGELVEYFKVTIIADLYQTLIELLNLALGIGLWWQSAIFLAARKVAYTVFKSAWFTVLRTLVEQAGSQSVNSLLSQVWQLRWGHRKVLDRSLVEGAAAVGFIGGGLGTVLHPVSRLVAGPRAVAGWQHAVGVATGAVHESLTEFVASGALSGKPSFSGMSAVSGALGHGADLAGATVQGGLYGPGTPLHAALARLQTLPPGGGTARDHGAPVRSFPEEAAKGNAPDRNEIPQPRTPAGPPVLAEAPAPPASPAPPAPPTGTAPHTPSDGAIPPGEPGTSSPDWSAIGGPGGDPQTVAEPPFAGSDGAAPMSTQDSQVAGAGPVASPAPSPPPAPLAPVPPSAGLSGPTEHSADGIILVDQALPPKELARELAYTRRALHAYAPIAAANATVPVVVHGLGGRARHGDRDRSLRKLMPKLAAELNRPEHDGRTVELVSCVTEHLPEKEAHATLRGAAKALGRDVISGHGPMWIIDAGRPEGAGLWVASEIGPDQRPRWPPNGKIFRYPKDGGEPELIGTGFHNWEDHARTQTNPADLVMRKFLTKTTAGARGRIAQLTGMYGAVVDYVREPPLAEAIARRKRDKRRAVLDMTDVRQLSAVLHEVDRKSDALQEQLKRADPDGDAVKAAVSELEQGSRRAHHQLWNTIASLGEVPVGYLSHHGGIGGPLAEVKDYRGRSELAEWVRDEVLRALPSLDPDAVSTAVDRRLSEEALSGRVPGVTGPEALFDGTGIVLDLGTGPDAAVVTIHARRPSAFRLQKAPGGEPADEGSRLTRVGRSGSRSANTSTVSSSIAASVGFNGMTPGLPGMPDNVKATISGSVSAGGGIRTTRSQTAGSGFQTTTDVGVPAIGVLPTQAQFWHGRPTGVTLTVATRTGVTTTSAPRNVVAAQAITVQLLNALVFAAPPTRGAPGGKAFRIPPKSAVVNLRLRAGLPETVAGLLPAGLGKPGGNARSRWAPELGTDSIRQHLLEITGNGRVITGLHTRTGAHGPGSGRDRLDKPISGHLVLKSRLGTPELITDQATRKSGHSGREEADASQSKGSTRFVRGTATAGPTFAAGPALGGDTPYFQGNIGPTASVDRSSGNTSGHAVSTASEVQDWNFGDHLLYRIPFTLFVAARLTGAPDVDSTALSEGPTGYVTIVVTRADARAHGFPLPALRRDTRPTTVPWVSSTTAGKEAPSAAHQPIYQDVRELDTTGLLDFTLARVRSLDASLVPPDNAPVDPPKAAGRRLAERQAANLRRLTSAIDKPGQLQPRVVELEGSKLVTVEITPHLIVPNRDKVEDLRGGETEVTPGTGKEFGRGGARTLFGGRSVGTGGRIGVALAAGANAGGLAGVRAAFARLAASWGWSSSRSLGGSRTLISGHTTETGSEKLEWHSVSAELRWSVRVTAVDRPTAPSAVAKPIEERTYEREVTVSAPGGATLLVPGIDENTVQWTHLAGPDESTVVLNDRRRVEHRQPVNLTGPAELGRLNIPQDKIRLAVETALSSAIEVSRKDRHRVNWPSPRRRLAGAGRWWPVTKKVTVLGDTGLRYDVDVLPLLNGPAGTELFKHLTPHALPGSLQPVVSGAGSARLWGGRKLRLEMPGTTTTLVAKLGASARVHSPQRIYDPQNGYHLMKVRGIAGGMSATAQSDSGPDVSATAQVTGDAGRGHKSTGQGGYSWSRRKGSGRSTSYNTTMVSLHKYTGPTVLLQVAVDITFEGTVKAKGLNLFPFAEPVSTTVSGYLTINVPEHVADELAPVAPVARQEPASTEPPATLTHMPGRAVVDAVSDWHRPDPGRGKPASLERLASRLVDSLGPAPSAATKLIDEVSVRDMVREAATELLSVDSIEGQTADLYNGLHRSFPKADGTVVTVSFHPKATNVSKGGVPHPAGYTIGLVNVATVGTAELESAQQRHGGTIGDTDAADVQGPPVTGANTSGNLSVGSTDARNDQHDEGRLQVMYTEEIGAGAFVPHTVDHEYTVTVSVARGARAAEWTGDPVTVDGAVTFRVSERSAGVPGMKEKLRNLGMASPKYDKLPATLPEKPGDGPWRLPESIVPAIEGVDVGTGDGGVRDAIWRAFANTGATPAQLARHRELSLTAWMSVALTGKPPSTGPLSSAPGLFQRDRVGDFGWQAVFSGQPVAQNGRRIYREHLVLDLAADQSVQASRVDTNGTVGETPNWGDNSAPPPPGIFTGPLLQAPADSSGVNVSSAARTGVTGEGDGHRTATVELAVEYVTDLRVQFDQRPGTKLTPVLEQETRPSGGPTGTLVHSGVTFVLLLSDIKKLGMFGWRERFLAATDDPALPENEQARMPSTLAEVKVPAGTHLEVVDGKLRLAVGPGPAMGSILDLPSTTDRAILVVDPNVPEAKVKEFTDRYPPEAIEYSKWFLPRFPV